MIQVVNKLTGEVYDLDDGSPEKIRDAWILVTETIKAMERAKDKLKPIVSAMLDEKGLYDYGDFIFRQSIVQRQNYDKSVMREQLDPDTFDTLLVPDKTAIDTYLKENIDTLGEIGTALRTTMLPVGQPYSTIRLEKVKRSE